MFICLEIRELMTGTPYPERTGSWHLAWDKPLEDIMWKEVLIGMSPSQLVRHDKFPAILCEGPCLEFLKHSCGKLTSPTYVA